MQKLYIGYITIILSALFTLSSCNVQQENSDSKTLSKQLQKKLTAGMSLNRKSQVFQALLLFKNSGTQNQHQSQARLNIGITAK